MLRDVEELVAEIKKSNNSRRHRDLRAHKSHLQILSDMIQELGDSVSIIPFKEATNEILTIKEMHVGVEINYVVLEYFDGFKNAGLDVKN